MGTIFVQAKFPLLLIVSVGLLLENNSNHDLSATALFVDRLYVLKFVREKNHIFALFLPESLATHKITIFLNDEEFLRALVAVS